MNLTAKGENRMPIVDMPLEELKKYNGCSPCPDDIDAYWDAALSEMKSVNACVTLKPAAFRAKNAETFDLTFTGTGGARVYAKYLRPSNISAPVPCVLQFHGYTGNSGSWNDKLNFINSGIAVAAMDCRGQAGLSEDNSNVTGNTFKGHIIRGLSDDSPEKLLFRQIYLDTAQLAGIVMGFNEIDENKVAATGGSQGGGLTLACAALEPKIKMAAPAFPFLCDYKRVWDLDLDLAAYEELRTYFRMYDPTHEREGEIFYRLGYIDLQNIVKRIKAEVLWGLGLMDNICPPSTQFAAYNKITSKKQMVVYPDFGHEDLPGFNDRAFEFIQRMSD
jgi:cephalosporin-C deacetylase